MSGQRPLIVTVTRIRALSSPVTCVELHVSLVEVALETDAAMDSQVALRSDLATTGVLIQLLVSPPPV